MAGATAAKGPRAASPLLQPHMSADLRRPQTAHAPVSSRFVLIHRRLLIAEIKKRQDTGYREGCAGVNKTEFT